VLSSYNSFLKSGEGLLVSASKKEKFAEFLAAANLSSPLQDGLKSRNSIQARFEERKLWAQIGEAFVDPDRRLGREETLKLIERFDKSYPESTLQKELTRRRNSIEAWRKVSYRYGIEIETPKGFYELTLMVRAEKGSQNLARTVTPVIAGNASAPEFSFSAWSDQALEIVVEVRRQGDKLPIYYQRRSLSAGQFEDEISRAFPTENGFRVRLSPR
jgi:hypothetical protein